MRPLDSKFADNLPSKGQIFDYWKDRLPALGILIDWGEPGCWACRFYYGTKYDVRRSNADWAKILRGWDRIPLQRCHVVPQSLGGTDDVDNLFLMCRECHDLAPNTSIPAILFEWARAQSSYGREMARIRAALDAFRVSEEEAQGLEALLESEEFKTWKSDKVGLHRPQSNYASTSYRLTPATFIGLAVYFLRNIASNRPAEPARGDLINPRQNTSACPSSMSRPSAGRRRRRSASRR
jgi:HNH endonuclease